MNHEPLSENCFIKPALDDLVLQDSSRGMDCLKSLFPVNHYRNVAAGILNQSAGTVLIATGFYVAGVCETDGPPGAFCMAKTLASLGYQTAILTDAYGRGLFEDFDLSVIEVPFDADDLYFHSLLNTWKPSVLISTERCGKNDRHDYANMRGISIAEHTAPIDRLFEIALSQNIYTVGIGDGGNEIGMGLVADVIRTQLELNPCIIKTSDLLIATVSNWGAYALSAALLIEAAPTHIGTMPDDQEIACYIQYIVDHGCVDGVTGIVRNWVDGFPPEKEQAIYTAIRRLAYPLP